MTQTAAAKKPAKPAGKPKTEVAAPAKQNIFDILSKELSSSDVLVTVASGAASHKARLPGVISTRCPTLDAAIGRGGIPMARLSIIAGGEAGGKTTIALHTAAECQAMGGVVLYVDNEHKLDLDYAKALGVNLDRFLLAQPGTLEASLDIISRTIIRVHEQNPDMPVLCVLDSMNASKSKVEYEDDGTADFTQTTGMATQARVMSTALPKLARLISGKKVAILMISQPREGIGSMGGYKQLVSCGNAPKYYTAVIIELIRVGFLKVSEKPVGSQMKAKIVKNQISTPFKEAEFNIRWGAGVDYYHSLMLQAQKYGILNISKTGGVEVPYTGEGSENGIFKWHQAKGLARTIANYPDVIAYIKAEVAKGEPVKAAKGDKQEQEQEDS